MNSNRILVCAALTICLAACNEKKPVPPAASAPAPAAAAAAPAPEVAAAPTGPDGPEGILIPKFEISVAATDIAKGKETFAAKGCIACHKVGGGKLVGPDLQGVLVRRTQTWVEKMILKPELMVAKDDIARALFRSILVPMANQNVDPVTELPFILSYLKSEAGPVAEAKK